MDVQQRKRKYVSVRPDLPGPRTLDLLKRRAEYVSRGAGNNHPLFVERAEGALIADVDGNTYLDFAGAIGTLNAGHRPPDVVRAINNQLDRYIHPCFHVGMYEPYVELAQKLAEITPGGFAKKALLLSSGAEAVENAVKLARKYTNRPGIVSFVRGFHGRTLLGMSLTSKVKPYKFRMGPFAPATYKAPYPYPLYRPASMTEEEYSQHCVRQFETFLLTEAAPEELAAVIMEPVQGEGGFIVPPASFVRGVYDICRRHGILFIADEIQTGFGRTGRLFASTHFGIEPDMIALSKSIAAGLPLSAVVGRAEVMDAAEPGEVGGTYGGSPLGCVAALAVIEQMEREDLPGRAVRMGETLRQFFAELAPRHPVIAEVRGLGAMCAIELAHPDDRQPASELAARLIRRCFEKGVVLLGAGIYGNVIRFLPPLVMTDEQLQEGLNIVKEALEEL